LEAIAAKDFKAISIATVHPSKAIVGFCIAINQPGKTWIEPGQIWIEWLGTEIKSRRSNIGQALIEHLIADAPSRGATKITCSAITKNRASMALLKKAGFERRRTLRNHWYGQDMHFFERMI
jgi:ribosomal protein S18 acetylase RimI-like enzyme